MIAVESLTAEMTTLPYLLHTFGQMSLVGLLVNNVIAVFIPLAMLLSAIAGLAGISVVAYAGWVSWPATLLLTYVLHGTAYKFTASCFSERHLLERYGDTGVIWSRWAGLHFKKPTERRILTDKNTVLLPMQERIHIV